MVGKRTDRVQSVDLGIARTGWESLPPRDRVEKRSAAGRVVGLSENAKRSQRKEGAQRKEEGSCSCQFTEEEEKKGLCRMLGCLGCCGWSASFSTRGAKECKEGPSSLEGVGFSK